MVARIKGKAHDLELLVALPLEGVELVYLVERRIEEMLLSLSRTHHEGRVGHIGVYLLDDEVFRTLALILVGTLACHLLFPFLFPFQVLTVALSDVLHNHVDGHLHTVLACARARQQTAHQGSLVLHVVDILEGGLAEVRGKWREDGMCHGRLIDVWCLRQQQLHEFREMFGHRRRSHFIIFRIGIRAIFGTHGLERHGILLG